MNPTKLEIEISETIKATRELRACGDMAALNLAEEDLRYLINLKNDSS